MLDDNIILEELKKIFSYKLAKEENQTIIDRGFVCSKMKYAKVLFVGMNPSYTKDAKIENYQYNIEEAVKGYPKHYSKFPQLLEGTKYKDNWSYVDMFQFRETSQKRIIDFMKHDPQFLVDQLLLTHKIISQLNPELIVVCNSFAATFFGINRIEDKHVWYGYDFEFDEEYGIDVIKSKNENSILTKNEGSLIGKQILFTSTLTYKPRFDKRRLQWQIKRLLIV